MGEGEPTPENVVEKKEGLPKDQIELHKESILEMIKMQDPLSSNDGARSESIYKKVEAMLSDEGNYEKFMEAAGVDGVKDSGIVKVSVDAAIGEVNLGPRENS